MTRQVRSFASARPRTRPRTPAALPRYRLRDELRIPATGVDPFRPDRHGPKQPRGRLAPCFSEKYTDRNDWHGRRVSRGMLERAPRQNPPDPVRRSTTARPCQRQRNPGPRAAVLRAIPHDVGLLSTGAWGQRGQGHRRAQDARGDLPSRREPLATRRSSAAFGPHMRIAALTARERSRQRARRLAMDRRFARG